MKTKSFAEVLKHPHQAEKTPGKKLAPKKKEDSLRMRH